VRIEKSAFCKTGLHDMGFHYRLNALEISVSGPVSGLNR
jgi:hypothetical protein